MATNPTIKTHEVKTVDYADKDGIKRRVFIPDGITDYSEGIPASLDVSVLFPDFPVEYIRRLTDELWARGLIEPCDYVKPGAPELIAAALRSAIKVDALSIVTLAHKDCKK